MFDSDPNESRNKCHSDKIRTRTLGVITGRSESQVQGCVRGGAQESREVPQERRRIVSPLSKGRRNSATSFGRELRGRTKRTLPGNPSRVSGRAGRRNFTTSFGRELRGAAPNAHCRVTRLEYPGVQEGDERVEEPTTTDAHCQVTRLGYPGMQKVAC